MNVKTQSGVSMIEVVITISIMGILLAAAMPSVGTWMATSRVRNTAESIQNGLQRARSEAIRLNKPMTFYMVSDLTSSCTLSSASGSWVVSATSPAGKCDALPSTTTAPMLVVKAQASDGGGAASVSATNASSTAATSVTFNGFGQITSSSSATAIRVVKLASSDTPPYKRNVEVSLGGVGRMCDPTLTANTGDTRACNNSLVN